jgi:hypothetical protein
VAILVALIIVYHGSASGATMIPNGSLSPTTLPSVMTPLLSILAARRDLCSVLLLATTGGTCSGSASTGLRNSVDHSPCDPPRARDNGCCCHLLLSATRMGGAEKF